MRLLPGRGTEEEGGLKRAENPQTGGGGGVLRGLRGSGRCAARSDICAMCFIFYFSCVSEAKRIVFPPPPPFVLLLMDRRLEELLPPRPPPHHLLLPLSTSPTSSLPSSTQKNTRLQPRNASFLFFTHRAEKNAERTVQRTTPTPEKHQPYLGYQPPPGP